jgi:hypothetical protein
LGQLSKQVLLLCTLCAIVKIDLKTGEIHLVFKNKKNEFMCNV